MLLSTWQALRGQPIVAPNALTLGTLSVLAFAAVGVALTIVLGAKRKARGGGWDASSVRLASASGKEARKYVVEMEDGMMEKGVAHIPPGAGAKSLWVLGEPVTCKTISDQTGSAYSHFEVESRPVPGPPPHVQHREGESFWVLEGEYEFVVEGHTTRAGVGSLVYAPRGNLHAHKNVGDGPGRMLLSQTPGAHTSASSRRSASRRRMSLDLCSPKARRM